MYDMHYDLLTFLYINMIENNKFSNKERLFNHLQKIYNNNIIGGIINLYFMTKKEMKDELDISIEEMNDIKNMFVKSIEFLNYIKRINIIPEDINFTYSIEGCDYIKNEQELEELYSLGLRAIIPVWNHNNQYGSGIRTNNGLTEEGYNLIKKAINLGMVIDVSHANENTFNGILSLYEKEHATNSIIIASHSNVKKICNNARNLNDEQLIRLRDAGGYIGLVLYDKFTVDKGVENLIVSKKEKFMEHLSYIIDNIGFSSDRILISTDNMELLEDAKYKMSSVIPIENLKEDLYDMICQRYDYDTANKIIRENGRELIDKIKDKLFFLSE